MLYILSRTFLNLGRRKDTLYFIDLIFIYRVLDNLIILNLIPTKDKEITYLYLDIIEEIFI